MVQGKPKIEEVLDRFIEFVQDKPLAAHNASFDINFINTNLLRMGKSLDNDVIGTLTISRNIYKDQGLSNFKLVTIKEYLGMNLESHRAKSDSMVAGKIYILLCLVCC